MIQNSSYHIFVKEGQVYNTDTVNSRNTNVIGYIKIIRCIGSILTYANTNILTGYRVLTNVDTNTDYI